MKIPNIIIIFFIYLISGCFGDEDCNEHKKNTLRLECELSKNYDPEEGPVKSYQDSIHIQLEMIPVEIELSDHDDKLELVTWMIMNWTDVFLTWDPNDYDNLNEILIDCDNIWKPDLVSLSTLAEDPYQSASHLVCKVNSTGSVSIVFSNSYSSFCSADRTYWPYDKHECQLFLGSRVLIGSSLNFTLKEVLPDNLKTDKVWDVKDLKPEVSVFKTGATNNETYSRLEFTFILKRHSSVYAATFVFPAVGISVIILAVIWLDIKSPERIYMVALIMFDDILFLEYFTFLFPASGSKPPLLVNFFRDSITMCGVIILLTIIGRQLINSLFKPAWLTSLIRLLNEKNIDKYFLLEMKSESSDAHETEDSSPSNFSLASQKQKEWKIFFMFIDRLLFIICSIFYWSLFIKFYPAM